MRTTMRPRFGYGSIAPWFHEQDDQVVAVAGPDAVRLRTPVPPRIRDSAAHAEFTVAEGRRLPFVLTHSPSHQSPPAPVDADTALADTEKFWAEWIAASRCRGEWADAVRRALITLKALTYAPTGGILAAAPAVSSVRKGLPRRLSSHRARTFPATAGR
ncbi:hypothetical protein ACFWY9_29430 [Amycolatopsis sp. NPDC059027]